MRPCRTTKVHNNHNKHVAETFDGLRMEERAGKKEQERKSLGGIWKLGDGRLSVEG